MATATEFLFEVSLELEHVSEILGAGEAKASVDLRMPAALSPSGPAIAAGACKQSPARTALFESRRVWKL